jgi:ATP-dependent Clp protease ATP-binding subunit ClpC
MVRFAFDKVRNEVEEEIGVSFEVPETTVSSLTELGGIYFPGTAQPGAAIQLLQKVVEIRCEEFEDDEAELPVDPIDLSYSDIVYALHRVLGLPLGLLDDDVTLNLKETREFFDARVIGQSEAISTVVDVITMIKAGLTDPGKPNSVMLFAGPTGVGKTELAKALAIFLFGAQDRMIRCDMSEYKDYNAFEKLLGRPGGENDAMNPSSSLVTRVRQQPFSVILLDEIEKAHPNVFDVLLQAFDDGRLSDPEGRTTDLTQTIIIMTSNLGSDLANPMPVGFDSEAPDSSETVDKALRGFFRPEFINRIDHIVRFRPLERSHIRTLARRELGMALMRNGLLRRELRVDVDRSVYDLLATEGYDELYGARPLRRQVEKLAVLPVARRIVNLDKGERGSLLRLAVKNKDITVNVVRDRQARIAERITRGIEVVDPVDGGKKIVRPTDVAKELDQFAKKLDDLETRCEEEKIADRKSDLLQKSATIDFWDDQESARSTLGEIYRLERLLEAIAKTSRRYEELVRKFEAIRQPQSEEGLRALALDLRAAVHFLELVRFGLECRNREDRRDAFIAVRLVDQTAESDLAGKLAEAYRHWARRKGYGIRLVHEESDGKKLTREIVMEISGPAVFGILRGEEGEHEFVFGKTSRLPKRNRFVNVRVLGTPVKGIVTDIQSRKKAIKEPVNLADRVRTLASASDKISGKSVELLSPLVGDEADEAAIALLRSEIERQDHPANDFSESVIRKYLMSPIADIKDQRAPNVEIKARDFWKGELDEVLHAGIEARLAVNQGQ